MDKCALETAPLLLLVDDNAVIAMNHKMVLQKNGFEVISVFSGDDAIKTVKDNPSIDMVLMDIDLDEEIDGVEAARRILALREVPVVFLTSHSERAFVKRVKEITNYGYVLKNAGEFVLIETIHMAFSLFDARQSVEREKEKYKRVIESTEEAVITYDVEGRVLLINPKAASILGGVPNDFIGKQIREFLSSANAEHGMSTIRSVMQTGKSVRQETDVEIDGVSRWFEMRYQPIRNEKGLITSVLQISLEITPRKRAEQELHALQTQYQLVAENSTDVIYVLDSQLDFTYLSPSVKKLFGYSAADFNSENLYVLMEQIIHSEDINCIKQQIKARFEGDLDRHLDDFRVYTADRQVRWVEVRANYVYGEIGTFKGIVGIIRDITRRKAAEQALFQNSIIFELFEELPSVTVVKLDAHLHAEYVSPSMQDVLGYTTQYFIGSSVMEVVHTEDRAGLEEKIARTIENKSESLFSEYRVYTKTGEVRWVETRARLFYKQKGEFDGAVYIQSDVTERKEKEIELSRALEENRHLMSELNHRVKNNLAMVSSLISLKDSAIGTAADLSDIRSQVRAISFIHEKLQKSEDITHINIKPYLEDLMNSIFSFEHDADFVLDMTLEPFSLPTKMVMNIGLILNELALNAIKHGFSEEEQPLFSVVFVKDKIKDRYILSVSNTGKVFPEDVDPAHTESLGLQLVSIIAAQMRAPMEFSRFPVTKFTFLIAP